jgi:ADP-ribose pyrophosphatase
MVPGGYLECGETLEGGAAREAFEETGLTLDPDDLTLYSIVNMSSISQIMISFRIQLEELPQLRPGPECLEVAFMSESEICEADFAWRASMGDGLARFFAELRTGQFSIQLITLASDQGTRFKWHDYRIR